MGARGLRVKMVSMGASIQETEELYVHTLRVYGCLRVTGAWHGGMGFRGGQWGHAFKKLKSRMCAPWSCHISMAVLPPFMVQDVIGGMAGYQHSPDEDLGRRCGSQHM